jgi:hypothetical protein
MKSDLPGSNATRIALDARRELHVIVVPVATGLSLRLREYSRVGKTRPLQPSFGALEIPVEVAQAVAAAIGRAAKSAAATIPAHTPAG